jgi:hypothetical protein
VPFVAYVHARDPDDSADGGGRTPWEPNWRAWRYVALALLAVYAAVRAKAGAVETLMVIIAFGFFCRAALEALPEGDGLREWRQ